MRVEMRAGQHLWMRRYVMPLAVGGGVFVADHMLDAFMASLHVGGAVSWLEDICLASVVVGVVYVLELRFEIASAQLRSFALDVAHQLLTPLAIQRSVVELGLQRVLSPAQYQDTLDSILEETEHLTRLVDSLLLIARMDSGRVRLAPTKINISEFVREVASDLEVLAQEKAQVFSVDANEDALVEVDRAMFRQVLMNLLSNAIKYTPEGGAIAVHTHRLASQRVEITVSDNGPGIQPGDQDKVFERFHRSVAGGKGTGLGLAISKWIVEAHKGTIACDRIASGGCRFTVKIPACDTI